MIKIAVWSCDLTKQNGQNIVTREVCSLLSRSNPVFLFYKSGSLLGLFDILNNIRKLLNLHLGSKDNILYVVASRSILGFLRDIPAYMFSFLGFKVVIHLHGSDATKLIKTFLIGKLALYFFRRSIVIVPSAHLIDSLLVYKIPGLCLIENFCNVSRINNTKSANIDKGPFVIFWNSNIIHSKGVFLLAEAVSNLNAEGFNVKLILTGLPIGDNFMDSKSAADLLIHYARSSFIDYIGRVNHEQMNDLLNASNLVCLPSWYESECQPLSIIEAMCFGKNIIISNSAAMLSTVGKYPSFIVSEFSSDALKSQIINVLKVDQIISMESYAEKARERFSRELFQEKIMVIFNSL